MTENPDKEPQMPEREIEVKAKDLPPEMREVLGGGVDDQATCKVKITVVDPSADPMMAKYEELDAAFEKNAVTLDTSPQDLVRRQRDIASGIISDDEE